jgi:hemerythrin
MGILKWVDELSVGVVEIDEQHKRLIEMINTFYDTMNSDRRQALGALLGSLVDYTRYHFSTEEKYMERFRFDGTDQHKREHEAFVVKICDVLDRHGKGSFVVSLEVTNFLKDWIVSHICGSDKQYSTCFRTNGLS